MASLSDPLRIVDHQFNQYNAKNYWHCLMKHKTEPSDYKSPTIQKRIEEIAKCLGSNSFSTPQGDLGLTPMCVAAIKGNPAGISFLLLHHASLEEKDRTGKTASQYLRQYHPELVPQFLSLDVPTPKDLLEGLPKVHLSNAPHLYKENTDDFGIIIQTLLMTRPFTSSPEEQEHYRQTGIRVKNSAINLASVCETLGIALETAPNHYMVRDHWIGLPDGTFALPGCSPSVKKAIERNESLKLVKQKSACYLSSHEYFLTTAGVVQEQNPLVEAEFRQKYHEVRNLRFYMEGGNHFLVSVKGKLKLIIGEDIVHVALLQFRLDKFFDTLQRLKYLADVTASTLSPKKIVELIEEMYAQGLIKNPGDGKKGFISEEEILNLALQMPSRGAVNYLQAAQHAEFFTPLRLNPKQIEAHRAIAANYFAQKAMTKAIIAKSFSVSVEDLIIIPQANYHLDVFIHPGPKKSFFVQDYEYTVALLTKIKSQAQALQLTDKDMKILDRYLQAAQEMDQHLKPLFDKTKENLLEAGFTVIPTPGIFYDISPRILSPDFPPEAITYNLNFMNGISGFSPKTNRYYYITTGAQVGDHLGPLFMKIFEEFLHSYQENLDVYYIGHPPQDPLNFKESMRWNNSLGGQFGIHCLTAAIKTQAHAG